MKHRLPARVHRVGLVTALGLCVSLVGVLVAQPAAQAVAAAGDEPSTLSGVVVRADGASPAGIEVRATCHAEDILATFRTTAGPDGSYSLPVAAVPSDTCDGPYRVEFRSNTARYAAQLYDDAVQDRDATYVTPVPGDNVLTTQTLSRVGGRAGGHVFDTYGNPVRAQGIVLLARPEVAAPLPPTRTTNPRGRFLLTNLLAGDYSFEATATAGTGYASCGLCGPGATSIPVSSGYLRTSVRVVLHDRARFAITTTVHGHDAVVRVRVTSAVTKDAAGGRVTISLANGGVAHDWTVRLRHGRAIAHLAVKHPATDTTMVRVSFSGDRHVASDFADRSYQRL
jgi:hypothetical protein